MCTCDIYKTKIWFWSLQICLVLILVPVILFFLFLVPANMSRFGFGPWPHFSDDLHTWHMMTEPIY